MKILHTIFKVLLTLLLITPILGTLGIFPQPTRAMYHNDTAFNFYTLISVGGYIMPILSLVFAISILLLWTKRTAFAALLILPITVNVIGFHWFLDGGPFTSGAIMANLLLVLNLYFLYQNKKHYKSLFDKTN